MLHKSPLTLASLSARKLFEKQYNTFERLPPNPRRVIAQRLAATFLEEGEEILKVLVKLKEEIETPLRRRDPRVKRLLDHVICAWIHSIKRADKALKLTLQILSQSNGWDSADVSTLAFYTEGSRWIGENIVAFAEEARCSSIRGFLFTKFKFYHWCEHPIHLHHERDE